ncbi:hypothetical protein LPTSP3_g31140 [Leptospira kobayashii]|uniref:DUF4760 domain-containing protein n=1 Tax=Leptospira kobayashii TaxID=1917830 RepID=A0ABN6KI04_9LEPT|nr:hypothetical protein [Leptospira kobayashii]BDA80184.1 hypothetical protein LPTSP3_g31140 [Leptospira kobayashii]
MMNWLIQNRDIIEILYFLSGVITSIGILIAFIQLRKTNKQLILSSKLLEVSNKDIELRSKREAISIALRECDIFKERIGKLFEFEVENGFTYYEGKINEFENEKLNQEASNWLEETINLFGVSELLSEVENILENFSSYFISELADSDTAFKRVGDIYIIYFKFIYPYIVQKRNESNKDRRNIYSVQLFNSWNTKIELKELESKMQKIQNEMNQKILKEEKGPIGTNLND